MKDRFNYNDIPEESYLSLEDIRTYISSFRSIYAIHRKLGIRAPQCGDFLEAFTRRALGLRKPPKGDAVDPSNRLIEIKSTVLSNKLDFKDNSVFSIRENAEGAFDRLLFTVWDPRDSTICIYDTLLDSDSFRKLPSGKITVAEENFLKRKTFISLKEAVVDGKKLVPIYTFNIDF